MTVLPDDHADRAWRLSRDDATARALVRAIRAGDVDSLRELLGERPGLAAARLVEEKGGSGTALHAATDWPGFFPNGPEVVRILIEAGADPDAAVEGGWHAETPLHWAASSDDVEVARALIDGGADIEAPGASIAGGQRRMAEYLLSRGADLNGTPSWGDSTPLDVAGSLGTGREALLTWLREQGAKNSTRHSGA